MLSVGVATILAGGIGGGVICDLCGPSFGILEVAAVSDEYWYVGAGVLAHLVVVGSVVFVVFGFGVVYREELC